MITTKYYTLEDEDIEQIKQYLKQNKLIQADLAKQMDITLPYFSAWLRKRRRLNQDQLNKLENITKITFKS